MTKKNLFLLILLGNVMFCSFAFAQGIPQVAGPVKTGPTYVSGNITSDTTWTRLGSPYIVTGTVTVNPGITLTIQPGVEVKFDGFYKIQVNGTLNAQGSAGNLITFTSNRPIPAPQDWDHIYFAPTSTNNLIKYVKIEYSKYGFYIDGVSPAVESCTIEKNFYGLFIKSGSASNIASNTIRGNVEQEMHIENSSPTITNNVIYAYAVGASSNYGVVIHGTLAAPSNPVVNNNSISGHAVYDLYANSTSGDISSVKINAQGNWWGTVDTKQITSKIYDYNEGTSYPVVDFSHYLDAEGGAPTPGLVVSGPISANDTWSVPKGPYTVVGNITVKTGVKLTINPGVFIGFDGYYQLRVDGTLDAQGTASNKITFTSNQTIPAKDNWNNIYFSSSSVNSVIKYAKIDYGQYAIDANGTSSLVVDSNEINNSTRGINMDNKANITITNNTLTNNTEGIWMENGSSPVITGNTIDAINSAIVAYGTSSNPSLPTVHNNSLSAQVYYKMYTASRSGNMSAFKIDAQNNWWGTADTKQISAKIYDYTDDGNSAVVNFSGYLDKQGGSPTPGQVISGPITVDTTFSKLNSPYVVAGNITVNSGIKLTVQPGAVIKFDAFYYLRIDGTLDAQGTAQDIITFTSNQLIPAAQNWSDIYFNSTSTNSVVKYTNIQYAKYGLNISGVAILVENNILENNLYGIYVQNSSTATINNNRIRNNTDRGIDIRNGVSSATVSNNEIVNNGNYGVVIEGVTASPTPVVNYNSIYGHRTYDFYAGSSSDASSIKVNAQANWWGTTNTKQISTNIRDYNEGSTYPVVDFSHYLDREGGSPASGLVVSGPVSIDDTWTVLKGPYTAVGNITVKSAVTLTINPGVLVKFDGNYLINVNGTLNAQGTQTNKIIFTSNQAVPRASDWQHIYFYPTAASSVIKYVQLEYSNYGLYIDGASIPVENCVIQKNYRGMYLKNSSNGAITNSTIVNNTERAIQIETASSPAITNNKITNNGSYGIVVTGTLAAPSLPMVHNNSIYGHTSYNFWASPASGDQSTIKLDAQNNWWGIANSQQISAKIYDYTDSAVNPVVNFSGYLNREGGNPASGQVISGPITVDTTFTKSAGPYTIVGPLAVKPNVTLTISPGTILKFDAFYQLRVDGTLNAQGQAGNEIVFTSNREIPAAQDWDNIYFAPTSGSSVVKYAKLEYSKYGLYIDTVSISVENCTIQKGYYGVFIRGGSASTISSSVIGENTEQEIHIEYSSPTITGNTFVSTRRGNYGVVIHGSSASPSKPIVNNNSIYGHAVYDMYANSTSGDLSLVRIDAQANWWGTIDTKQITVKILDYNEGTSNPVVNFSHYLDGPGGNPTAGEIVSGPIGTNTAWTKAKNPYIVVGNITVNPAVTLTINPGVLVRFDGNYQIQVDGTLTAIGSADDIITFTSNQLNPGAKNWSQLYFSPTSGNSVVKYSKIEYANTGLSISGVSPIVQNTTFENNYYGIYVLNASPRIENNAMRNGYDGIHIREGSSPIIQNNTIMDNSASGIAIGARSDGPSRPTINNNSIYNNVNGIYASSASGDLSLVKIDAQGNWWGTTDTKQISSKVYDYNEGTSNPVVDFSHYLDGPGGNPLPVIVASGFITSNTTWISGEDVIVVGNLTVNDNITLTVQPKVFVGFDNNYKLTVNANATLLAQGTATQPIIFTSNRTTKNKGDWQYVWLSNSSRISYANVEYSDTGLRFDNASPTIQSCTIKNNNYGIHLSNGSSPAVTDNRITTNGYGIYIYPSAVTPPHPLINDNFIENNTAWNLYASGHANFASQVINAEDNWWGSVDPAVIATKIYDRNDNANSPLVDFDPFKTEGDTIMISDTSVDPRFLSASEGETTNISYTINKQAAVTLNIYSYTTKHLVRTLLNKQARNAGSYTEIWNGKNDAGVVLPADVYYFTIKAEDAGGRFGEYDPVYVPGTTVIQTGSLVTPSNFDPYKGETANVNYDLAIPAWATIKVGVAGALGYNRLLISNQPRDVHNTDIWDGRSDNGSFVGTGSYVVYGFNLNILPDNAMVIKSNVKIEELSANPYVIYSAHGDITKITYTVSENAVITLEVLNPSGVKIRTLVNKKSQRAGTYTEPWNGEDDYGRIVSVEGNYKVKLTVLDQYDNVLVDRFGNVTVFK